MWRLGTVKATQDETNTLRPAADIDDNDHQSFWVVTCCFKLVERVALSLELETMKL